MSWLLLDVGNTRAKAVVCHGKELGPIADFPFAFNAPSDLQGVLYASVAQDERIAELKIQSSLGHLPWRQLASTKQAFELHNSYACPETLGVDRWLAMLGGLALYPCTELMVVDAGTAVTIDHVNQSGQHQGGWIVPGLRMQHKAVTSHTAKVLSREFDQAELIFGQNTDHCLKNGITAAICGLIAQAMRIAPNAQLLLTGGDSEFLAEQLRRQAPALKFVLDPWLIFRGMQRFIEN